MDLSIAEYCATSLMEKHNLIQNGWVFKFDNAITFFGRCHYGSKTITLSKNLTLANDEQKVINTILHEIAHALTPNHNHDPVWVRKAIEIGCDGKRCYSEEVINPITPKYTGVCPNGHEHKSHRKRVNMIQSCGMCDKKYNPSFLITWEKS